MTREVEHCTGGRCFACSDEAVPATVLGLLTDDMALVDFDGVQDEVSVALVDATVGDVVLVHAKEALTVIEPAALPDFRSSGTSL